MSRPRVVIVGAGFAGYQTARTLSRITRGKADITLLNPTDYFLYLPLLPQVAAGVLEPRRVTVSLSGTLPRVRLVLGEADGIDLEGHTVHYTDPEGDGGTLAYDRLVLAVGSVNKLLPVPGVAEHAHGFRGMPEALYLRDHVTRQVELAAASDDPKSSASRCTFVVVGAGYTGTEVAAQGQLFTDALVRKQPLRQGIRPRWMLLDIAPRVLPELDERLSRTADRVLRRRGVEVRTGTSVEEATSTGVRLSDGEFIDTRTLVWCVGVRPDPLVEGLGRPLERGRLLVDPYLQVPGHPEVFACGDAAAVPDLEKPGQYTPMTAQHAWRHGKVAGRNVAASLGFGERREYRHRDMGFTVDLGGVKAAANPLGVPLSGPLAGAVTRGYHLAAMPGNRIRVAADWFLDAVLPRQAVQLGLVRSWSVPLDTASPELARVAGAPENRPAPVTRGTPAATSLADTHAVPDPGRPGATGPRKSAVPDPGRPGAPGGDQPGSADATNATEPGHDGPAADGSRPAVSDPGGPATSDTDEPASGSPAASGPVESSTAYKPMASGSGGPGSGRQAASGSDTSASAEPGVSGPGGPGSGRPMASGPEGLAPEREVSGPGGPGRPAASGSDTSAPAAPEASRSGTSAPAAPEASGSDNPRPARPAGPRSDRHPEGDS
ncbi:FAD-dependent oxidoreductase [Streptomyces sp. HC44]|uniref:FAD-dependent oxidoreductase n=1 Tax=Streptomyces scabichelini TaxID=2711217 RepID=A0A6G4V6F3_9ACTN|nr:FAD-dependent oxidoreductase [Streptomyces scabichelini]NGO09678.1 FAD-dependent oxidoreductase [Streptomyces scabichelini]